MKDVLEEILNDAEKGVRLSEMSELFYRTAKIDLFSFRFVDKFCVMFAVFFLLLWHNWNAQYHVIVSSEIDWVETIQLSSFSKSRISSSTILQVKVKIIGWVNWNFVKWLT